MRIKVKEILKNRSNVGKEVVVKGWVRTVRKQKDFSFIEINDGSSLSNLQVIVPSSLPDYEKEIEKFSTGASMAAKGKIVESPGAKQSVEMHASELKLIGPCDPTTYPLQKKKHTFEFLRTIAHLRARTNTHGAVTRVRNYLSFATHKFFQERGFYYLNTPIITLSDCEGAGQLFQVTTLDLEKPKKTEEGKIDHSLDFFSKPAFLTVSGQLNAETYACALSDVYTFGPTFRAENSHTSRHLAEFWMIEPEMAFADIFDDMDLAEAYLKYIFKGVLEECSEDLELFEKFIRPGVIKRLQNVIESPFPRLTYTEGVALLEKSGVAFEYPVKWGSDLQTEHERYLCEKVFNSPIILRDYPEQIKAFYMRRNDDGKTVAAMDVLVPDVGEIIGGSQREERMEILIEKMDAINLDKEHYQWYLDLRKYGSVPHAGFGAGFERLVLFATGMENIRDVIPFPRFAGYAEF